MKLLVKKVREAFLNMRIEHEDRILVACSGGPDSVALLLAILELKGDKGSDDVHVAHYHHGLRGDEARRDAAFVEGLCRRLHCPFHLGEGKCKEFSQAKGVSVQEGARLLRYRFLKEVKEKTGSKWIATAHTLDDQVEEVIMRILRGTSLDGLAGIPAKRQDGVVRPFLGVKKTEIFNYLEEKGQGYIVDSSNLSTKYTRNKVRAWVVPRLKDINPGVYEAVARTVDLLNEDREALQSIAAKAYEKVCMLEENGRCVLSCAVLKRHPKAIRLRVYKMALEHITPWAVRDMVREHLEMMDRLFASSSPSAKLDLPNDIVVRRIYGKLEFFYDKKVTLQGLIMPTFIHEGEELRLPGPLGCLSIKKVRRPQVGTRKTSLPRPLYLDANAVDFPLLVRARGHGERFWPLGAPRPYKLKDYFINRKFPRHLRSTVPLLVAQGNVIAVAGIEVSETSKITDHTTKVLEVQWRPGPEIMREFDVMNM